MIYVTHYADYRWTRNHLALILFILWARKLGVMKEIVPSPYQMKMKKEKEEKGKESKSKGPEEKPALK